MRDCHTKSLRHQPQYKYEVLVPFNEYSTKKVRPYYFTPHFPEYKEMLNVVASLGSIPGLVPIEKYGIKIPVANLY